MHRSQHSARMEAACTLLAAPERRFLLYGIAESGCANLDDLVPQIAAWLDETPVEHVDADRRDAVRISLVHNHLPRLADYDVVEYDVRSGDVVLGEGFADLKSLLGQFRETEAEPTLRALDVP